MMASDFGEHLKGLFFNIISEKGDLPSEKVPLWGVDLNILENVLLCKTCLLKRYLYGVVWRIYSTDEQVDPKYELCLTAGE